MSFTAPEQPVSGQDPQATPATPAAAPVAPPAPSNDGPWAGDLNLIFQDPAQRAQVDQFLRTKVQPYTTQLEQQQAAYKDAARLWDDLSSAPVDTYVAMTTEMFGEEAGATVLQAIQALEAKQAQQTDAQPVQGQQAPPDPRLEAVLQWAEQSQAQSQYESEMARVVAANPDVDEARMHTFVAVAEGDFDKAVQLYREDAQLNMTRWLAALTPEQRAIFNAAQPATPAAPPAIGSDTGSAQPATTPTQPRKESLDDAISGWISEQRASRAAPPVGSV